MHALLNPWKLYPTAPRRRHHVGHSPFRCGGNDRDEPNPSRRWLPRDQLYRAGPQLEVFFAQAGGIKLVEIPFEIPPYHIYQLWHERLRHDPANRWFRKLIAELFMGGKAASP